MIELSQAKKIRKRLNQTAKINLIYGVARLIEMQRQFAVEFGLNLQQIFPQIAEYVRHENMLEEILSWLTNGTQGASKINKLMRALADHQLALLTALDGVAKKTLLELNQTSTPMKKIKRLLSTVFHFNKDNSNWKNLFYDSELRYKRLVVPGFVNAYIQYREKEKKVQEKN